MPLASHPLPQCGSGKEPAAKRWEGHFSSNFAPGGVGTSNTLSVTETNE